MKGFESMPAEAEKNSDRSPFAESEDMINQLIGKMGEVNFEEMDEKALVELSKEILDDIAKHLGDAETDASARGADYAQELAGLLLDDLSMRQFTNDFEKNNLIKKPALEFLEAYASPKVEREAA